MKRIFLRVALILAGIYVAFIAGMFAVPSLVYAVLFFSWPGLFILTKTQSPGGGGEWTDAIIFFASAIPSILVYAIFISMGLIFGKPKSLLRAFPTLLLGVAFLGFMAFALLTFPNPEQSKNMAIAMRTKAHLIGLSTASELFHKDIGRWPTNLAELQSNPLQIEFFRGEMRDQWKRPFVYETPSTSAPGRIGTFGADGVAGGKKSDGDQFQGIAVN